MFCPQCGAANADNTAQCTQCGTPLQPVQAYVPPPPAPSTGPAGVPPQPYTGEPIPNYLWQSIVCTVLTLFTCCFLSLPFAIVAIVFSTQVNSKLAYGDIAGAKDSSNKAKIFCWISIGIFGVIGIVYMLFVILGVAGSMIPNAH